ncbi:MAG: hypothetical protein RMI34_09425 [Chloroherpetonaceae bacterium]|nr:hypothetical protein [Chloroherpetonaceae bacterium]
MCRLVVWLMGLCVLHTELRAQFRCDWVQSWIAEPKKNDEEHSLQSAEVAAVLQVMDSMQVVRKPKLLPENMSIFESVFWGESGLFRGISPLTPEARRRELDFRRAMLSTHQLLGFATLGLMTASVVFGQVLLNDYEALRFDEAARNRQVHRTLSIITFGTYMTTAAMSTFAPPPLIRRDEWNTVTTHKLLAVVHLAGMIAQPILAISAANSRDFEQIRALRRAHQIVGYVTLAALATAMVVMTF